MKKTRLKIFLIFCVPFVLFLPEAVQADDDKKEPEFDDASAHDPSIIKVGDEYYAFGTHIEAAKSPDLLRWENFTNGYEAENNTLYGDLSKNLAESFEWAGEDDADSEGGFAVWAPEIIYNSDYVNEDGSTGAYMLYYSVSSTYIRSAIGYAVSEDIEGPYEYVDTIIYSDFSEDEAYDENSDINKQWENTNIPNLIDEGVFDEPNNDWFTEDGEYKSSQYTNAIDPNLFYDEEGKLWMTYGSWAGGIYILEVDSQTGQPIYPGEDGESEDGRLIDRYFGEKISGGYGRSGEGPYVVYDDEADYYYLYVTYGGLDHEGGYQMRQFRSKNPNGPYEDASGQNAVLPEEYDEGRIGNHPDKTDHYPYGNKMMGNFIFEKELDEGTEDGTGYVSPGHNSFLIDEDLNKQFLVFHSRFPESEETHYIRVHQTFKNSNDWPVPTPFRYAGETIEPVDDSEVTGSYKYINHGKEITADITKSEEITFHDDNTITGAVSGEWEKYDDYRVNVKLDDGNDYDGVFLRQWDPDEEDWVMAFSAMSDEGVVIWGSHSEPLSDSTSIYQWLLGGSLVLLLGIAIFFIIGRRKKQSKLKSEEQPNKQFKI